MMTAEQLKASILQMAMQGKLVEQRAEEGTGEELYQKITADKKLLIKNGNIKKGKSYDPITEDKLPFDIPASWTWVRLTDVVFNRGQKIPDKTFSYIDIGSIDNVHQQLNNEENIVEPDQAPSRARKIVQIGDIIYSTVRPYLHNMCIIDREFSNEPIASTGFAAMTCHDGLFNKFLFYYLQSPDFDSYANDAENSKGVAYPAINDQKLYKALIPLPPLEEQKRIVAKIEELMPFVEQYAKASTRLNTLNAIFPDQMKKSILQQAVMGKLVPQDPNDEPASVLLKKIAEEKQKLIKEGKIKKQKALQAITEDEIPFDIPESWEWVRLEDVTKSITDGDHQAPPQTETGISFLVISNVSSGFMDFSNTRHVPEEYFEKLSADRKPAKGDILFTVTGSYGIPMKVETEQEFCFQRHIALIKPMIDANFLVMLLKSPLVKDQCDRVATGTAQKTVGLGSLRNILVPIPPVNEQIRILETLKHTIPLAESLS